MDQNNYREQMFNGLVKVLESIGKDDKPYDQSQKAKDMLEVLELVLASTITATSADRESVRESCEESYFNIRKIALTLYEEEQQTEPANNVAVQNTPPSSPKNRLIDNQDRNRQLNEQKTRNSYIKTQQAIKHS